MILKRILVNLGLKNSLGCYLNRLANNFVPLGNKLIKPNIEFLVKQGIKSARIHNTFPVESLQRNRVNFSSLLIVNIIPAIIIQNALFDTFSIELLPAEIVLQIPVIQVKSIVPQINVQSARIAFVHVKLKHASPIGTRVIQLKLFKKQFGLFKSYHDSHNEMVDKKQDQNKHNEMIVLLQNCCFFSRLSLIDYFLGLFTNFDLHFSIINKFD
jgi:hypothetical protein